MQKILRFILLISVICFTGCKEKINYNPEQYFTKTQQDFLLKQSVRYSAKLPPQATHETKFNSEFDPYYNEAANEIDLRACYPKDTNHYYFLMTRKARSIWPAREAIGGQFKIDKNNKIQDYEEAFRTWKMTEDTLKTRSLELFDLMVQGKDLTPYHSKYKGDRYIEFPDDRFVFDKIKRRWHDKELDSLMIN